jgi:hypothetical protein
MQVTKRRGRIWSARLGLLALALNALVSIRLAFDIAEAFEPAPQCAAHVEVDSAERHLVALVSGHRETDGKSHEHRKHHACPVCSALNALAGFIPPADAPLSFPTPAALLAAHFVIEAEGVRAAAAYRSCSPPRA